MAASIKDDTMDEDFTGFDEEPIVVNSAGILAHDLRLEDPPETDSDSGALVIADNTQKAEPKNTEKSQSPKKRRSRVYEDATPTRAPSSRVRGQGLAYLIAMEKGGSKKQLAKAQAQVEAQDTQNTQTVEKDPPATPVAEPDPVPEPESAKKVSKVREQRETVKLREKETVKTPTSPAPDSPAGATSKPKIGYRKSHSGFNISSPLLREPFKEGWRREVVYRATVDPGTKTLCDVYYYAPDGKKLRSGREVTDYLEKLDTPLTPENFTFFKEPIGMDSNQEVLRYAKTRRDDVGNEKLISKKEKALKAREEELRKNLQELGEDVAAITAQTVNQEPVSPGDSPTPGSDEVSPQQRKKRGPPKMEKQLKIKLWGKGLRSKENAEPSRKDEADFEEETPRSQPTPPARKPSPTRKVPDDISHLFAPHTGATPKEAGRPATRGARSTSGTSASGSGQQLELINGKRFVSVGPAPEAKSPTIHAEDHGTKRSLPSPGSQARQSPKRAKLSAPPPPSTGPARKVEPLAFGSFPLDRFNSFVSHAYHGLLHVFRYLTVQELMAAAGVCKLWRDLALHHSHWRLVRLKNSRIYDWPSFTSHLRRAGTQHLDMRKLILVASPDETWANFEQGAPNLFQIERIDLCRCPSQVLVAVSKNCPRLKYIDAQFISSSNIHFESLGNLKELEELKIRSFFNLTLDDSLEAFSRLIRLKTLSLTTVSNLKSSELNHLAELPALETLELGDCTEWGSSDDYRSLARLTHLRHLRLENGPETSSLQHLEASLGCLSNLQQLELVNFAIDAPISSLQLAGLKRFLIIPNYSLENLPATMRHLFECLVSMSHLQQLCWVVTEEILKTVTDGQLPLEVDDAQIVAGRVTVDELEDLLRQRLANTSVLVRRLPKSAARRYSLSVNHED